MGNDPDCKLVWDALPVGVVQLHSSGQATRWNCFAAGLIGRNEPGIQWMHLAELLSAEPAGPSAVRAVTRIIAEADEKGTSSPRETLLRRPDGVEIPVEIAITKIAAGPDPQYLAIIADLTRKKEIEKLVEEQRARAVAGERFTALGEMAAGIAHEINNPVAIIHSSAEVVIDLLSGTERIRRGERAEVDEETLAQALRFSRKIAQTALRISRIVRGMKQLARDGSQDPFERADLSAIVEDTIELCGERYRAMGVALDASGAASEIEIHCRPSQISQILLNLLSNAFDAVLELPERWVRVETAVLTDEILLSVTDSGQGLPEAARKRIFEPFFTLKPAGRGTGLGLSISRRLATEHAGRLEYDPSSPNTRFVVFFPGIRRKPIRLPAA